MTNIHIIEKEGWQFAVVKTLNFSVMQSWEIRAQNEDLYAYGQFVNGPYLTEQEAIDDIESASELYLQSIEQHSI